MRVERIESLEDPRVADYRNVRDVDLRAGANLFMTEGRLGVRRLLRGSRFRARSVFVTAAADRLAGAGRLALAFGTEGEGLSDAALAAADARVRIPMAPGVDSLNVATASGIALHRFAGIAEPGAAGPPCGA